VLLVFGRDNKELPELVVACSGATTEQEFIAAATFTTSKLGYVFKKGVKVLGYYKDVAEGWNEGKATAGKEGMEDEGKESAVEGAGGLALDEETSKQAKQGREGVPMAVPAGKRKVDAGSSAGSSPDDRRWSSADEDGGSADDPHSSDGVSQNSLAGAGEAVRRRSVPGSGNTDMETKADAEAAKKEATRSSLSTHCGRHSYLHPSPLAREVPADLKANVKKVVAGHATGIQVSNFHREWNRTIGKGTRRQAPREREWCPLKDTFTEIGFKKLTDFLRACDDVIEVQDNGGSVACFPKFSTTSAAIQPDYTERLKTQEVPEREGTERMKEDEIIAEIEEGEIREGEIAATPNNLRPSGPASFEAPATAGDAIPAAVSDPSGYGVWVPRKDLKTGRIYWTNHALQKTAWRPPKGGTAVVQQAAGHSSAPPGATSEQ